MYQNCAISYPIPSILIDNQSHFGRCILYVYMLNVVFRSSEGEENAPPENVPASKRPRSALSGQEDIPSATPGANTASILDLRTYGCMYIRI